MIEFHLPYLTVPGTYEEQMAKVEVEVLENLYASQKQKAEPDELILETFDVLQSLVGLVKKHMERLHPYATPEVVHTLVERYLHNLNDRHQDKIEQYASERGWEIVAYGEQHE